MDTLDLLQVLAVVTKHDTQELHIFSQEVVESMVGEWADSRVGFERLHIHSGQERSATRSCLHFSSLGLGFHGDREHRKGGDATVA